MEQSITIDVTGLTPRHIAALRYFAQKFVAGAREHGDLAAGKVWTKDMLDETIDFSFYTIFELLELMKDEL